jgi:hypothetical protein
VGSTTKLNWSGVMEKEDGFLNDNYNDVNDCLETALNNAFSQFLNDDRRGVGILFETVLKETFTEFLNDNKEEIIEAIANKEETK